MNSIVKRAVKRWFPEQRRGVSDEPLPTPRMSRDEVATRLAGESRLHLGCGGNVIPGWANLDLHGEPPVVECDLSLGLPCPSNSMEVVYSEHFIEHIGFTEALGLVTECHRALKKGGVLRLSTPSLEVLVSEYQSGRLNAWADVNWIPDTACHLINEGMRSWGHRFIYDRAELLGLFRKAGFTNVVEAPWRTSAHRALQNLECRPFHNELIFEATK